MSAAPPELQHLGRGHHRFACPECARTKARRRDTALSVDVTPEGGVYFCHRCGYRGGWRADRAYGRPGAPHAARPQAARHLILASHWLSLWHAIGPVSGTARAYLKARGCALPPPDGALRCAERLRHPAGYVGPALVALVSDALTGEVLTLHRTWIKGDGTKADVNPPRLLLGQHRKAGGVIRLFPTVETELAVAEGIESALAVATERTPVWSTIDAGNMAGLAVISGVENLLIVADHDPAGLQAARACARRWRDARRTVRVAIPPVPGQDACDLVEGRDLKDADRERGLEASKRMIRFIRELRYA